ncbi:MAG: PEP-CTERM sorting domain-containing protein [Sedimentisphaerales bacterium]|nr:PEP-CTERM sorting domain-containing protein [Sedimentisphaerales bacterium]
MRTYMLSIITVMALIAGSTAWAGLITNTPDLPPDGDYVSPESYHEYSAAGIILDDPVHRPLMTPPPVITSVGPDEMETFDSTFDAAEVGMGLGAIHMEGPVSVKVYNKVGYTTGTFNTEIISMSLSGNTSLGPIIVRESPTLSSMGITSITDIGGGSYDITSFFDVFTELSVDGGQTWIPCDASTRMTLVPEPATLCLLALGGLLIRKRK